MIYCRWALLWDKGMRGKRGGLGWIHSRVRIQRYWRHTALRTLSATLYGSRYAPAIAHGEGTWRIAGRYCPHLPET